MDVDSRQNESGFLALLNCDGTLRFLNDAALRFLGLDALPGTDPLTLVHPEDAARAAERLAELLATPGHTVFECVRVIGKDGRVRHILAAGANRCADPGLRCIVVTFREAGAEEREGALLRRLGSTVQHMHDRVVITDADGVIVWVNPAFETRTGYSAAEAIGRRPGDLVRSGYHDPAFYQEMWGTIRAGKVFRGEFVNRTRNGEIWREEAIIVPIPDWDGRTRHYALTGRDVTELRRLQAHLEALAYTDTLTELANRRALLERGEGLLTGVRAARRSLALLFIDLDRFKNVNDTLGHPVGDALLVEVARRFRTAMRPGDLLARLGGDEFAVVVPGAGSEVARQLADRLREHLRFPVEVGEHRVHVQMSVGIAVHPQDGEDLATLMGRADSAMYLAKSRRSGVVLYSPSADPHRQARIALEASLHEALDGDQFRLVYQPIVDLSTGHSSHVEALARWRHPERGEVSPGEFLPLLEEAALTDRFDRLVLGLAARQVRAWQDAGTNWRVAVNLCARTFCHEELLRWIDEIVAETGIDPARLVLEITESAAMGEPELAVRHIRALTSRGLSVAVDDFGTGYSSFAYLQRFDIGMLKIDRVFTAGIGSDPRAERILESMLYLGRRMGICVVAEGVETVAQARWLLEAGCDRAQGFYFARPGRPDDLRSALP